MKRNAALSASLILTIVVLSILAITYSQSNIICSPSLPKIKGSQSIILSVPLIFGIDFVEDESPLNQTTRVVIYSFIRNNPGMHFRSICDSLGLPVGIVQYHLALLAKAGLVTVHDDKRYRRYFESKRFRENEMKTISFLRRETPRRILAVLAEKDSIFHMDLASRLGISSQALSWQTNHLKEAGLINVEKEENRTKYALGEGNEALVRLYLDIIK